MKRKRREKPQITAKAEKEQIKVEKFNKLSIIPNACTSMNLVCGFSAIIAAHSGAFLVACWLIIIANIFDILDGRLARLTSVESRFGAELDSLCDLVSFGVAPAFLLFTRYFVVTMPVMGGIISTLFVLCGALRLARFNVTPASKHGVFEGLPIPGAAGLIVTMTIFDIQFFRIATFSQRAILFIAIATSLLMVSKIEYPAMKKTQKTGRMRRVLVLLITVALLLHPPVMLFLLFWAFGLYGPVKYLLNKINILFHKLSHTETPA